MNHELVLSFLAENDLIDLFEWSVDHFGERVRDGYEELVFTVMDAIRTDPLLAGSHSRPDIGPSVRSVHLKVCRDRVSSGVHRVRAPRHLVFYRNVEGGGTVQVSRILHETRDFGGIRFL